jgi:corrinoid protein of di/trimethylamine methyltransferase
MGNEIFDNLEKAVKEFSSEDAANWAKKAVEAKLDPLKAVEALTGAIRDVGDAFAAGDYFLPELLGAAEAMQSAMPILNEEIKKGPGEIVSAGTVVAGTVAGDIHNIGKSIFCTLLSAEGFQVVDLGVDVPVDRFLGAVKEHEPDIVAMSALLTITASEQKNVIEALEKRGVRNSIKVLVGGAAISQQFADSIGADGYDSTAVGGVRLARDLLGV